MMVDSVGANAVSPIGRFGERPYFYHQDDGGSLLDVKDVFVFAAIRIGLFLIGIAMQIEHIDFVKGMHQALTHATEGGIIQIPMIGDHAYNALARLVYLPLGKTKELYIIVLQPFWVI